MAHPREPASQRQIELMRAQWADGIFIKVIAEALSADRAPGEPAFNEENVRDLRRVLALPRRHASGSRLMLHRHFRMNEPPLGRLPDDAVIADQFAGRRFTDAQVPPARGRVPAISRVLEGMAS